MSIFDRFFKRNAPSDMRSLGFLMSWNRRAPADKKVIDFLNAYLYWTYACVSVIAENVASVGYKLYRKTKQGDLEEVIEHPVLDLLRKVNPWMTEFELREMTQIHLELTGEAWWLLERNSLGEPVEIWPLIPAYVSVVKSEERFIDYIEYRPPNGEVLKIPAEDVIRLRCVHPFDYYRGWSATKAAALPLDIHQYAQEWVRNFFFNDATPSGILTTEQVLAKDDVKRLREEWEAGHRGLSNAHKIAVLSGGLKFQEIQRSLSELEFTEVLKMLRDDILAIYRVPKHILGITEDVNRANAEAAEYTFAKRTIQPKLKRLEEQLNEFLLPQFEENLVLKFDNPVPDDWEQKIKEIESGVKGGWLTINEARQMMGLEPFGKEFDVVLWLGSYQPIGVRNDVQTRNGTQAEKMVKKQIARILTDEEKEVIWRSWIQTTEKFEREIVKELRKFFDEQEKKVIERLETVLEEELKAMYMLAKRKAVNVDIFLFDDEEENEKLRDLLMQILEKAAKKVAEKTIRQLNLSISFDVVHPAVRAGLKEQLHRVENINETTKKQLRKELLEGLEAGEDILQLKKRVESVFEEAKGFRAETIARTETNAAANLGAMTVYKQSNVVKELEWVAALDERTRPAHAEADGQRVPLGSKFYVGGEYLRYPSDPLGSPSNVINCRCVVVPITIGEEED